MLPASLFAKTEITGHGTASEAICDALRRAILEDQIQPGQPLPQSELASGFGVSIIPVREALKHLEAEGLVTFMPNKGAMVIGMNESDILEYSQIRAILEERAAAEGVRNMTRVDFARVEDAYEAFVEGVHGPSGRIRSGALNRAFHNSIYASARSPRLLEMIEDLHVRLDRYIRGHLVIEGRKDITDLEHKAILDACRNRDADLCAKLTRAHILEAAAISIDVFRSRKAAKTAATGT
ncbi:GntR family transcriptional regulator [Acetobacter pasteurianus]|uniref:GntR family transcriptional regulator n=5 Tax=Acetobacter pasteurianus TaxID=438 RepID=A0A401WRF8_ACEPA|nr:GntR family transcriptional regulator [Acetobacter pasteurianus]BAU37735.1 GntR family transcriptional regulator [Acetobacter pasteurianus NBRC 101655]ASC04771.1 HTH-type transcriptional repressor CsiR [Acetobacter pasteurianus subsp. pasteurianus]OAZ72614.1 HTH-type transcriptional repressor CsiR [Acetobacter pasteurianus]QHM90884.1 GntR family transcriptional regulator [Acetobacter pasteurianus]RCL08835.1 GntR family transcriptional regulator [Acetobacter pasteurianus]